MWRLRLSTLRGAWWAYLSLLRVRRALRSGTVHPAVAAPPRLPQSAARGVAGVLGRLPGTCLERALIKQAWNCSWGDRRDVVIGLPAEGFGERPAHAWVDGLDEVSARAYIELHRLAPQD